MCVCVCVCIPHFDNVLVIFRNSVNHGVLYNRPLHRDNWGLILVLRLTKHISIQCAPDIIFHTLISIYSKIAYIYYQDMTCMHGTTFNFS